MEKQLFLHTPTTQINSEYALFNHQWRIEIKKINAVFVTRAASYKRYPITFGIIFLAIGFACEYLPCIICGFIFLCSILFMRSKYMLRIKLCTGEIRPIVSYNKSEVEEIKEAIEKAIMHDSFYDYKPTTTEQCKE